MNEQTKPLIFSIAPEWINEILQGRKTYELRRRPPKLLEATRAYLYETRPSSRIRVRCVMGPVVCKPKELLWEMLGEKTRVTKVAFDAYFRDLETGSAISIDQVEDLGSEFTLPRLRLVGFSPPQAWCRASADVAEMVEGR